MASDGRLARLRIDISDEPGMLMAFHRQLAAVAATSSSTIKVVL